MNRASRVSILVLTSSEDDHFRLVEKCLIARGAAVFRFDPAKYPNHSTLSIEYRGNRLSSARLQYDDIDLDLLTLQSVWIRRPGRPLAPSGLPDSALGRYIEEESAAFLNAVWHALPCRFVPARVDVIALAEHKACQLATAAALGLRIPETLITNQPDSVLDFCRSYDMNIVSKVVKGPQISLSERGAWWAFTEPISIFDLASYEEVRACPTIFQRYVQKQFELRVTVVGSTIFAVRIDSQSNNRTRHDWRHYDLANTPHTIHTLPSPVRNACIRLVHQFSLEYGAIDMIVTPSGEYIFLELNPNGQFAWLEEMSGVGISDALAAHLMAPQLEVSS